MPQKETTNAGKSTKSASSSVYAVFTLIYTMILDVILYAAVVPLIATYLTGACAKTFYLAPKYELLSTTILTFVMVYGAFCVFGESVYWKHLFAFDPLHINILTIRDIVNVIIGIVSIVSLASTIETMAVSDRAMKPYHISEGTGYFFVKTYFGWLHLDHVILPNLGLRLPHKGGILDPDFGENGRFEHGAAYMFYWAVLSSCAAKLVYFNTLSTFLRAMEIFMTLNPKFDDDEDDVTSGEEVAHHQRAIRIAEPAGEMTMHDTHGHM